MTHFSVICYSIAPKNITEHRNGGTFSAFQINNCYQKCEVNTSLLTETWLLHECSSSYCRSPCYIIINNVLKCLLKICNMLKSKVFLIFPMMHHAFLTLFLFSLYSSTASTSLSLGWKWRGRQQWREADISLTLGNIFLFTYSFTACARMRVHVLCVSLLMKNPVNWLKAKAAYETTELSGRF